MDATMLRQHCEKAIANLAALGLDGRARVMLMVRGTWPKRGEHKRLAGRHGGPLGRCVSDNARPGYVLCDFVAAEVIAWLDDAAAHTTPARAGESESE